MAPKDQSETKNFDATMLSPRLDQALRWAAVWHQGQTRKSGAVPYIQHPVAVAWCLDRLGFAEDVVIAALLHDVVEDSAVGLEEIADRFGQSVADLVNHCSERKTDEQGRPRPWPDRKQEHLEALRSAPVEARAIALADRLHNLQSIAIDLANGESVWERFRAPRDQVLWYYRTSMATLTGGDPRLETLARQGQHLLASLDGDHGTTESTGPENDPRA